MCLNPKYIKRKGVYVDNTWNGLKGEKYEIECYTKCGYCAECVAEKANNWVIRNFYEEKAHEKKCFITLTYAKNPYFLVKKDIQDFVKRLRRYLEYRNQNKIKIFTNGEYGEKGKRPHYHIIIYGWNDPKAHYKGLSKKNYPLFESDIISKLWKLGFHTYQEFHTFELPYITLYDTPKNTSSFNYRMKKKNAKKRIDTLYEILKTTKSDPLAKSILNQIKTLEEEIENEKNKYITIKEFNTWSVGLGYSEFEKEILKNKDYDYKEYIFDKTFATPTPWIKKIFKLFGLASARQEMLRRSSELDSRLNKNDIIANTQLKLNEKHIKDAIKYADLSQRKDL